MSVCFRKQRAGRHGQAQHVQRIPWVPMMVAKEPMIAEYQAEYCNDPECEIPHSDLPLERAPGLPPYRCGDLVRHQEVAKPGPNKADPEPDGKLPHQHGADCLPAGKVLPPDMDQGNEDCENGQEKRHDVCYGLHAEKYKVKGNKFHFLQGPGLSRRARSQNWGHPSCSFPGQKSFIIAGEPHMQDRDDLNFSRSSAVIQE